MALSSYDELLKQVASLKTENCHLRRELQDNSSHLTKLENDASNMKDVLSHIQVSYGDLELEDHDLHEDCGKETGADNYNEDDQALASHTSLCDDSFEDGTYQGQATAAGLDEGETSMTESTGSQGMDVYGLFQKLDSERKQLLQELDRDDKQRNWFYNQPRAITQKMESLQHSEKYSGQTDTARCQLELEALKIEGAMHEKLGVGEQSKLRQEARLDRIRNIETEIKSLPGQTKQVLKIKPDQDDGVGDYASERSVTRNSQLATLAVQTGEVTQVENSDGVAPGIPLSSNMMVMYHGAWPMEKVLTSSGGSYGTPQGSQDLASVISFNSTNTNSSSSLGTAPGYSQPVVAGEQQQQLGTKVEMVYSLLSMLGTHDKDDMSRTLFAMSQSQDSCIAMRQSGCLPLLLQLLHGSEKDSGLLGKTRGSKAARTRAAAALHHIVHCNHDDKRERKEARTLRLLEQIRAYCDQQRGESEEDEDEAVVNNNSEMDHHPGAGIAALMKLSFDEDYRHAICTLGGLQAIAELLEVDNQVNSPVNEYSTTIRRYSCMALTNLTFGDGKNKALLCSMRGAMEALTDQLCSSNEDLIQAAASVLRNLSWRADLASKKTLREIGSVTTLMKAAMNVKKETTLKSILSALWNLSSHCSENKAEICAVEGALTFLVCLLTYKSTAKTLAIIENGGGILRNISSQIAIREDYRQILRNHDCLKILLHHLRSPSLTIVSNACGTLWNLSARCEEDQNALREMGAVSMLRNLVHSKHKMISSGSSAALRNLLSSTHGGKSVDGDKTMASLRPSLHVRKQRALETELDNNLTETCENIESPSSPTEVVHRSESEPRRFVYHVNGDVAHKKEEDTRRHIAHRPLVPPSDNSSHAPSSSGHVVRTGSQDSVGSTHSDISHDRTRAHTMLAKSSLLLNKRQGSSLERNEQPSAVYIGTPRPNHPPVSKVHNSNISAGNTISHLSGGKSSVALINNTPAHSQLPHHGTVNHHHHPQTHSWQTMPKSRIIKYMQEVAMYAGVEPTGDFHGTLSLTQSSPAHFPTNQHPLLDRFAKPSGIKNFKNISGAPDHDNHRSLNHPTEEDTDQPVNYSLKYKDGSANDRSSKQLPSKGLHLSYTHMPSPASNNPGFRPGPAAEHVGPGVSNDCNYFLNNSNILEQVSSNTPRGNTLHNSSISTPHRPVPNLIHNRLHTPQGFPASVVQHHHPHFMTPQVPYSANSLRPRGFHYPSGHPIQNPNPGLPSNITAVSSGFTPRSKLFNPGTSQFHTAQTAHQNTPSPHLHPVQPFSAYAETDLDLIADQPTDFSLRYSEVSEEICTEDYQEQPINYSTRFLDNGGGRESQDMGGYEEERHCVECKYAEARRTNERIEICSSDDQVRTFCTEGTPYLSTATSLTDLTQAGKNDREDEEEEEEEEEDSPDVEPENNQMTAEVERGGTRGEMNATCSSSGSQTTDRHTSSTVIGCTARGQGLIGLSSTANCQHSETHRVQQNFHADTNEGALDQTKTYCEEGTPVCFSRVSSLSSLHCAEPRENIGHQDHTRQSSNNEKVELTCIDEADTPEAMVISVIENKAASCTASKSASSLRRTNTDQVLKGDRESKTVTFDENNQVEETPLMFSRCSSPESLSSFDTQSVHSSVISEYSRRASEVVSPSEIPDSPSESMPSSPRLTHSPTRRFKDFSTTPKATNAISKQSLSFEKTPSTIKQQPFRGFDGFDEEDKPINFAMRNQDIPLLHSFPAFDDDQPTDFSSVDREIEHDQTLSFSTFQKNNQSPNPSSHLANKVLTSRGKPMLSLEEQNLETESSSGKSEVPVVYAEEGTPPNFSETTSLSGITMASGSTRPAAISHINLQEGQEPDLLKVEDKETGSEIVQRIESPAVSAVVRENTPGRVRSPAKEKLKREDRDSSMSDVSEGEEDILAQCISSGMPTPVSSTRKMRRSSSENTAKKKSGIPTKTGPETRSKNASKLSSVHKAVPKKLVLTSKSPPESCKSDNSSVENEELLLSQTIESGMPKNKSGRKYNGGADHSGVGSDIVGGKQSGRDCNNSAFIPRTSNITVVAPFHDFIPTDTIRTYNVEGTPKNFSTATSLSDLTVDSEGSKHVTAGLIKSSKAGKDLRGAPKQSPNKIRTPVTTRHKQPATNGSISKQSAPQQIHLEDKRPSIGLSTNIEPDYITFSPPSNDTLHIYGVEGTPTTFSRNDSLSSLGGGKDSRGTGSGVSASPHKDHRFIDRDESDSSCSFLKERHVIGQSSEDSSVTGSRTDRPIKFAVEDTPVCFSRNSSLSSLNSLDKSEQPDLAPDRRDKKEPTEASAAKNQKLDAACDDDSLSDELADCDPTPSEQALLDQCINSAMPKSRLTKGEEKARRHSRAKFLTQRGAGGIGSSSGMTHGNGLTKSASLEMSTVMTNGYLSGSEMDHRSQSSLSLGQSSSESLMTRSCSDTTELDLSFQIPRPSSRRSRYNNWHLQKRSPHNGRGSSYDESFRKGFDSTVGNISREETDRLLAENVSKIVAEMQTSKMVGSTMEDEIFIENETVSLVSNDYASDTNSENSVSWSVTSDRSTEPSAGDGFSQSSIRSNGPRILKPGAAHGSSKKAEANDDDAVKVVRGHRKPLYPGKANNLVTAIKGNAKTVASPGCQVSAQSSGSEGIQAGPGKLKSTGVKKTPPKNPSVAQISSKSVPSQVVSTKNGSPLQKNVEKKTKILTTMSGKSDDSSPSIDKTGTKSVVQVPSQVSKPNKTKAVSKIGGNAGIRSTITAAPANSPAGVSTSPGHVSPLTGATKGQSKLSTVTPSNKSTNKPGENHNKTSNITTNNKRTGQNEGPSPILPAKKSSAGCIRSPNSPDHNRQQTGNSESNRHTLPNGNPKKQTPTKIATLKKNDDSRERSPQRESPLSSASSSSSRLPISTTKIPPASPKPCSLPPSGLKSKAATLPNSSLSSSTSKSRSVDDQISKSATYEKITSDLHNQSVKSLKGIHAASKSGAVDKSMKLKGGSFDSPESEVRRGEVFELCDEHDYDDVYESDNKSNLSSSYLGSNHQPNSSYDPNESLENNVFENSASNHNEIMKLVLDSTSGSPDSFGQNSSTDTPVDNGTFKRKKRDVNSSDFELPNADETCHSMCSFNDTLSSPQTNSSSLENHRDTFTDDTILRETSLVEISGLEQEKVEGKTNNKNKHGEEKAPGKAKSIVAQGLKKLFSSKHKDKEAKNKASDKPKNVDKESKTKHSKSNGKDKKKGKERKENEFFKSNLKIESTLSKEDEKLLQSLRLCTVSTMKQMQSKADINGLPPLTNGGSKLVLGSTRHEDQITEVCDDVSETSISEKHTTKTDMLLARRRKTNLSSSHSEDSRGEGDVTAPCMITTV